MDVAVSVIYLGGALLMAFVIVPMLVWNEG